MNMATVFCFGAQPTPRLTPPAGDADTQSLIKVASMRSFENGEEGGKPRVPSNAPFTEVFPTAGNKQHGLLYNLSAV